MLFPIIIVLQTLIFSIIAITVGEFFITEVFLLTPYMSAAVKTQIFLIAMVVFFALNYFFPQIKSLGKKALPFMAVILIGLIFGYKKYQDFYAEIRRQPKIYSISSDWTIQAKRIVIEGRAFGWPHENSMVVAGGEKFMIDVWEPNRIVASGPLTGNFGVHQLQVIRHDGRKTEKVPFTFKDPIELAWKE